MEIKQVHTFVNAASSEALGRENVVNEDLSNIVETGTEIFNANAVDKYVKALVNHIGKVIFVNRKYSGVFPSIMKDGWEYGSVMEKIQIELPDAEENTSWSLTDGVSYDPNKFTAPRVSAKFYNDRVTFEVDMSIAESQVKQSFSNSNQLNAFVSAIFIAVENSMTIKMEALAMRTMNNMIANTFYNEYNSENASTKSGVRAVNILYLYNNDTGNKLTADKAIRDPEFIRYASMTIANYTKRMTRMSSLFNIGGKARFTSSDKLNAALHSDFVSAASAYLQSDTFHEKYVSLPNADIVTYWQGSGTNYSWEETSKIMVTATNGKTVTLTGIIGTLWDDDALGINNLNRRVTTNWNGKGEFYNHFFKMDAQYFNDTNENFVVFFAA